MPRFGRVATAMITPYDADGRVDVDGAVTLARWLTQHGSEGLVVTGTTGEAAVLSDDEKVSLWRAVTDAVDVPVLAGTGTYDTHHSIELTKQAEAAGVDGILVVTPYYVRPSQAGIESHMRAVASATALPVMIYDVPGRTGRKIDDATRLRLVHEVENIVALKDAAGDVAASARFVARAPEGVELYSGDDSLTLPMLSVGAVGVVCVASHWAGNVFLDMVKAFEQGDVARARECNQRLLSSFDYETSDANPYPIPAKRMMRELGLPSGAARPPHVESDGDALADAARRIIDELGLRA